MVSTLELNRMSVAQAAVLFDLVAAGVRAEMGEEVYPWFGGDKLAAQPVQVVPGPVVREVARPVEAEKPKVPLLAMTKVAKIWHVGEPGGLTVVVHGAVRQAGQVPMEGAELELLHKMLSAIGLPGVVNGWAVVGQPDERVREDLQAEMMAAVNALKPERLLVLGGVALGTLLGRACGVEGWREEDVSTLWPQGGVARVGVTYPPKLLLEKPVFKRLAWQHLLAWQIRNEQQESGAKA